MGINFLGGGSGTNDRTTVDPVPITGRLAGECILAPLLTPELPALSDQLKVATTLAQAADSSLQITTPITVPEQTPLPLREQQSTEEDTELLDWARQEATRSSHHVDAGVLSTRRLVNGILRTIAANDVDTVVLPRATEGSRLTSEVTEHIARRAECDSIVVNGRSGFEQGPSILLPVAGGVHSGLATDAAHRIAADSDAWIDILHVVGTDAGQQERDQAEEYVDAAYQRIARPETTTTWILEADDPTDAIIEQSQYYSLTVIGAPTKGRLRQFIFGSTNESIRSNARSVVLSARNNTHGASLSSN